MLHYRPPDHVCGSRSGAECACRGQSDGQVLAERDARLQVRHQRQGHHGGQGQGVVERPLQVFPASVARGRCGHGHVAPVHAHAHCPPSRVRLSSRLWGGSVVLSLRPVCAGFVVRIASVLPHCASSIKQAKHPPNQ